MQALRKPLLVLLCALFFLAKAVTAQHITKIEYFFDTDPGFGKGFPIAVTPGADVTASFDIDISSLSFGFHNLYIRGYIPPYQETENGKSVTRGGWSFTQVRSLYKEKFRSSSADGISPVVAGEYFIDTDPGYGKGHMIPITQGTNLDNVSFSFDVTSLSKGFHQLHVRFKNANGAWSTTHTRSFYKEIYASGTTPGAVANITQGEYFFDQDPGFGKATPISLIPGTELSLSFTADVSSLSKGFHQLHVRFRDANGAWANTLHRSFYKETYSTATLPLAKINKVEYFIDTDPGFGKGTPVTVTPAYSLDSVGITVDMSHVSIGNHKIYVRAQDEAGVWSMISSGDFKIEPPTDLIITLGTINTTICAGSNVDIPFTVNSPFGSNNVFTAQLSDANGSFSKPVVIGSVTGNDDSTIQASIPAGTGAGTNYRIRVIGSSPFDTSGNSMPIIIKRIPEAHLAIAGPSSVCIGTSTYSANPVDPNATTYTWSLADGGTLDTIRGTSINVNWTKAGSFQLKMTASNQCGSGSEKSFNVKVFASAPSLVPVITASGKNLTVSNIPPSDSVNGYKWYRDDVLVTGLTGSSVAPTQDGHYTVRFANTCGEGPASNGIDYYVNKQPQTINFTQVDDTTYGTLSYVVLSASASSGLPVTYSIVQSGSNSYLKSDTLYIASAGNFTIKASQAGNNTYAPATATMSFVVRKAPATITFSNLTQVYNGSARQPVITTLPTGLTVTTTYDDNTAKPTNAGSYKVVATISHTNYQGVDSATFVIEKATQAISLARIPDLQLAAGSYKTGVKASSNLPVTLSLTTEPAGIATVSGDSIFLANIGQGFLVATQEGNNNYHAATPVKDTFEIKKATQVINFPAIADQIWGSAPFALNANASSGLPVSYRLVSGPAILNNNTVTLTGLGSVVIEATQAGNDVYSAAMPVQRRFAVVAYPDLFVENVSSDKTEVGPGETVTVSWKISNIGTGKSPVKWTERIAIQNGSGANKTIIQLNNFTAATTLDTASSMTRSLVVTLPVALNVGDEGHFVVELLPDTSVHEQAADLANNKAVQQSGWSIRKVLSLDLSATQITEGATNGVTAMVKRSGSIATALTVNILAKYPQRLTLPASVTIPAGQAGASFTIAAPNNNAVEGTLLDSIQVSASQFAGAGALLSVLDNDQAALTLTNLPANAAEGATVTFNVNTNLASAAPLTVYLTSNKAAKFPVPASVIIPAGSTTVPVTVVVPQNAIPEVDQSVEIKAGATAHTAVAGTIVVKDDDLPNLELVLQTTEVSEGAGIYATKATLRRTGTSNNVAFTANLSTSIPGSLILPNSISLNANENEKTFDVGVVDNTLAEGQRQVAIMASVYIASCGCSAPPTSSGSVSASLTIHDNDGPALTLAATPLTLAEGAAQAGLLRITRNTSTTAALTVHLSTSDSSEATLPATAIIPAGKAFVEVPVTTYNDGIADGSQTVYFTATATGFANGSVWAVVSDQNKPDLSIPTVSLSTNSVQSETLFNYQVTVRNNGLATAPAGAVVHGYLSNDDVIDATDSLLINGVIDSPIPVGQSAAFLNVVKAPNLPGQHKLLFKVNPDNAITELLLTNNAAQAVVLTILPDYSATAQVQPSYFLRGDTVHITGTATNASGSPATSVPVEVYIITQGIRRTITAMTNGSGQYSASFVPLAKEAGHYIVGASFPGMNMTTEQDAFDILGVRINNNSVPQFKVMLGDTLRGSLNIENMSPVALTGLTIKPVKLPGGAVMEFATIASLAGNGSAKLNYSIVGKALSTGSNFELAQLEITSQEGLKQGFDALYFCQAPNAYVVADVQKLDVAVSSSVGERLISFKLVNKGQGNTGAITVNLPQASWLNSVTPVSLTPLATGDTGLVVLKFMATSDIPFNVPVNSSIGIQIANGNSFALPFTFEKKAESKGAVEVNVTNQFTFYSQGEPKVAGARVQIKNYFSGVVYADGVTGSDGVFRADGIPEGRHRIVVEKEKHDPHNGTLNINPGDTTESSVFLNYRAIQYSWSVVPTAVQDQYDITLTAQFETHVPMPVVTIDMPKVMPQLSGTEIYAFNVTLTNHGLIAAKDVTLSLPASDPEYEFITNYVPADLLAQQSIQVPVIMRRRSQAPGGSANGLSIVAVSRQLGIAPVPINANTNLKCSDYAAVSYWYMCSISTGLWEKGGTLLSYSGRACYGGGIKEAIIEYDEKPYGGGGQNTGPTCAICPEPPGGGGNGPTFEFTEEKKSCVECILDMFSAALECLGGIKFGGSLGDKIERLREMYDQANGYYENAQTAICVARAAAAGSASGVLNCFPLPEPPGLGCAKAIGEAALTCMNTGVGGGSGGGGSVIGGRVMDKTSLLANSAVFGANLRSMGASSAMSAPGSLGTAVFRQIADNFALSTKAYEFRARWSQEYFGEMIHSDAFQQLAVLIAPSVTQLDSIYAPLQTTILTAMAGYEIPQDSIQAFFDRWNASLAARKAGVLQPNAQYPGIIDWTKVKAYSDSIVKVSDSAISLGYASVEDLYLETFRSVKEIWEGQGNQAACASVTVQFSQKLTMTREAFEGTLSIFNGHPTDKMDSLSVNIQITDEAGVPSNGLFQVNTKSLSNLSDVTGTGQIPGQGTGMVKFLFIPELGAAPTAPRKYNFGGHIRYFDPYQKQMVTMPMSDVLLTVNPSPNLMLHYFMERNILGDDALTTPDIEPSVPAELAVMVENQGYGPAVNMTISSAQPKIIENEKGLAINFNLIGSNFQGQPRKLGVTDINFGTIPGQQTRIGQWYFTSSLLGKFVSYEANVVHANSFGNPELSLVKGVRLHELTKSIRAYASGEDGINDFLVNDIFDVDDVPDAIYFSQGNRTENVRKAANGSFNKAVSGPAFTNTLTVTASQQGWNYIKLNDPGSRKYELVSVTRDSDGQVIPLDNAWLTFVTLPVSAPPVYENKFHFVDTFASQSPVTYTVIWKPRNLNVPKVVKIEGVPAQPTTEQVKKLTVVFDKAIDASTFTKEDLVLTLQGGQNIIDNSVVITTIDTASFEVDLTTLTRGDGFYAFTVQAADVKDIYGINGTVGKQVTWTQFLEVPAVQAFTRLPAGNKAAGFDTVGVVFNMPIDETTVTPQRFMVTKDGVAQSGSLNIDSVSADKKTFYLSGLGHILTQSGEYALTVDVPNIRSASNIAGIALQSVKLIVDKDGPALVIMARLDSAGLDAQHTPYVRLQFNEGVVGFNTAALKLTRNGQELQLNIDQLTMVDAKAWLGGNFGMLTYPDGAYTLSVDMSKLQDSIGNSGTGMQSISWTVDRASLITISNLTVSPDLGFSGTDGVTASDSLMVSFTISNDASQITLSQVDLSGETVLTRLDNQAAGTLSIPVTSLKGGNSRIKIMAVGTNGGTSTVLKDLYIDEVPLTGQWLVTNGQHHNQQVDNVPIRFSAKLLSHTGLLNTLELKRNGVVVPLTGLSFQQINDTVYRLVGLPQASSVAGNYQLLLQLPALRKYSSGKAGAGVAFVDWTVQSQNKAPVAKAGSDIMVNQPGTVTLNASASVDPDGDPVTYRWVAPDGVTLSDSTVAMPSFTLTGADKGKTYTFLLIVSDGDLYSTDKVSVSYVNCPDVIYYVDNDGDGFGNSASAQTGTTCAPLAGYVTRGGDCDDNNANTYPGSGDACNSCASEVLFYSAPGTTFQWQVNDGSGFRDLQDDAVYSGTNQQYLQLTQPPTSWNGYSYRCLVTRNGVQSFSPVRTLNIIYTWTGAVSSAWEDAANWSCNKVPDEYTDVKVPAGVPLILNSDGKVRSITFSQGSDFTIRQNASLEVKK